jgi:hypothetical protein
MTQQVGGSVGLAVITAVITSHAHGQIPSLATFTGGLRDALTATALIGAASVAVAAVILPRRDRPVPMTEITSTAQVHGAGPAA